MKAEIYKYNRDGTETLVNTATVVNGVVEFENPTIMAEMLEGDGVMGYTVRDGEELIRHLPQLFNNGRGYVKIIE